MSLGRIYNRRKKAQGGTGANQHKQKGQIDLSATNTAANLAAEHLISEKTVRRAGKFAEEVAKTPTHPPAPADALTAMPGGKDGITIQRDIGKPSPINKST